MFILGLTSLSESNILQPQVLENHGEQNRGEAGVKEGGGEGEEDGEAADIEKSERKIPSHIAAGLQAAAVDQERLRRPNSPPPTPGGYGFKIQSSPKTVEGDQVGGGRPYDDAADDPDEKLEEFDRLYREQRRRRRQRPTAASSAAERSVQSGGFKQKRRIDIAAESLLPSSASLQETGPHKKGRRPLHFFCHSLPHSLTATHWSSACPVTPKAVCAADLLLSVVRFDHWLFFFIC